MRMFISLSKAFGSRILRKTSLNCASLCICSICFFLSSCSSFSSICFSLCALVQNAFSLRGDYPPGFFFLDEPCFFELLEREANRFAACLAVVASSDFVVGLSAVLVPQAFGADGPVLEHLVEQRGAPFKPNFAASGNAFVVRRGFNQARPLGRLDFRNFLQFFRRFFDNVLNRFV